MIDDEKMTDIYGKEKQNNDKTITIKSVSEFIEIVCKDNNEIIENGELGDRLLFRGQADKDNKLIPSVGRPGSDGRTIIDEERNMIEMARYKLPNVFTKDLEPIELLALLQHHGIPTRLLDVSENALVGLYFACHDDENTVGKDGEVIIFKSNDSDITNYPKVNAICASYKSKEPVTNDSDDIMFVYAPSYSLRQNIQRGRYILFTDSIVDGKKVIEAIPKNHKNIIARLIVPAEIKKQVRRDLRLLGISKELLFLDNTDMVCKEIAERFSEER